MEVTTLMDDPRVVDETTLDLTQWHPSLHREIKVQTFNSQLPTRPY